MVMLRRLTSEVVVVVGWVAGSQQLIDKILGGVHVVDVEGLLVEAEGDQRARSHKCR